MSFAAPAFFAGLLVVPLAIAGYLAARRRSARYAVRFPGVGTLAAVLPPEPRWRRHLPLGLFVLALALLCFALARPEATVAVPIERAAVVLVSDSSRSMLATDVQPSRLDAAVQAGRSFLESVPDELRVGLVGFSDAPHTVVRPTTEHDRIRDILEGLPADGATATGDALAAAIDLLEQEAGGARRPPAAIVLLSDGKRTAGRDTVEVAREAARRDLPVHTVSVGTSTATVRGPNGELLPVPPDPETMREVARVSAGRAFTADDAGELGSVYESLGSQIGTKPEKREITAGFAAGGIALLLAAAGVSVRRSARLP